MNVTEILANPLSQQLLASAIPARFAYTALDGDPRVVMRPHIGMRVRRLCPERGA